MWYPAECSLCGTTQCCMLCVVCRGWRRLSARVLPRASESPTFPSQRQSVFSRQPRLYQLSIRLSVTPSSNSRNSRSTVTAKVQIDCTTLKNFNLFGNHGCVKSYLSDHAVLYCSYDLTVHLLVLYCVYL